MGKFARKFFQKVVQNELPARFFGRLEEVFLSIAVFFIQYLMNQTGNSQSR